MFADVRRLKKWLVDDDNDDAPTSHLPARSPPARSGAKAKEEDDFGLGQILLKRLYLSDEARASEKGDGVKKTVSQRAKSILHRKDAESDEEGVSWFDPLVM